MQDVATAKYTITGLVDQFDEQKNIVGQYPVGSVQELPVEFGDAQVEAGNAEKVDGSDEAAPVEDEPVVDDVEADDEESDILPDEDAPVDAVTDDVE